ncbi:cadherin-related tumor suppressor [Chelonus insularis]|uniref:cadherin-related tumor suppressor n=1 Tax=Chelonus insularis TaxID=460826 RepID=UPI00158BCD4B|nr:cadherin-related tumor suppressor [Chelonus insularis]
MWRLMIIVLIFGLVSSVRRTYGTTTKVTRLVPRRSPMLPQDGNMDLAMQSRAVDTRVQLSIREGEPEGTLVGIIPVQQNFTYRFNEPPQEFTLDPDSGQIKTAKILDRESLPSDKFDLVVLSSQPTHPIEVRIHVLDVNDNDPEFPESSIAVSFSESAAAGTKLLLDTATDKDTPENGVADDYFIVDGNIEGKFRLDVTWNPPGESSYLYLETTGKLDREQVEFYFLNVCARDRGKPPRLGYLAVNVTVLDVNDNPPIFQQSDYVIALNESVPVGTKVLTVKAYDKDSDDNAKLTYYLPDTETQFIIDPETGTIETAELLDCPQQSCTNIKPGGSCPKSCVITVFAKDHGSPRQDGRTYVTVNLLDANDHDPEIKFNYFPATVGFATVDENAAKDSLVAAVLVIDNDEGLNGETTVEIRGGNELEHFKLYNTQNFEIVRVNGRLDREEIPTYNLTIVATDKGTPPRSATAYLVIHVNDVNDHDPVFKQSEYSSIISELAPIGSFVASISATDADSGLNSRIYYDFDSGNEQSWFAIDSDTGLVTTIAQLDREIQGSVELRVTARDGGPNPRFASTHLRVTVLDENDEAPKFAQNVIEITLSENIPPHSLIATLTAIDNDQGTNGSVAYSLHSSVLRDYSKSFELDVLTGQLTTKIALDRETIAEYRILIIAKDQGTPPQSSTATVLVSLDDVNDNAPVFYPTKYFISIPEDTLVNTSIGNVKATDADASENSRIKYSLESGGEGFFKVDERNGDIYLQNSLRFTQKTLYKLIITAKDMGDKEAVENAIVEIMKSEDVEHLDFDTYNGYEFKILEDYGDCSEVTVNFNREVGSVSVTQFPKSQIIYSIIFGDPKGNFIINEHTGIISTAKCLDREEKTHYTLEIMAKAGLARGIAYVNITILDVNDNEPKFPKGDKTDEINLKENVAVGQEVYLARARDRDIGANARISYTLTHNPGKQFRITENSGIIYLAKPIQVPPGTVLSIEVTAVDNGLQPLSAQHQIRITIEDVNNHTPVFKLTTYETSLPESTAVNDRFFSLKATDADLGINGQILYSVSDGNDEDRFGIFPDGQLYVKHVLDREQQDYYALEVTASDQGKPRRSSVVVVIVHIIDENDNAPQFTNSSFIFHMRENEPPETFVGKLLAIDKDVGRNADLTFSLLMNQQDLYVDPRNGFIKSLSVYDREELVANTGVNYVNLEAIVMDNGINRLQDKVKVSIYITDINDNAPLFQRLPYRIQVSESAAIGTQLLRVYTTDADEGLNGDVFYSLEDGNQNGKFIIDEATGQISLAKELDRETCDNYVLIVVAHDAGLQVRLSSSATVNIDILDENDNAPTFIDNKSQISIIETTPINSKLLQFKATDNDLNSNSELTFAISYGNRRDTFYIDPSTGILYLKKPLDYEEHKSYTLNISCTDAGHPKMSSTTSLRVDIIDDNDNPPIFPNTAIVRQIREGITVRTPVHSVTAEDPDSGDNGAVTYEIMSQDPDDQKRYFGINPLTGVIHTLLPIDREEVDTFKLVVVATDCAKPPSPRLSAEKLVIVIVEDLNDNAPVFISMLAVVLPSKLTLSANVAKEMPVARVLAHDLDSGTNGLVTYELMRSEYNYLDMFKIHRSTGVLTMKLPKFIEHLDKSFRYQIGIRATDEAVQAERRSSETYLTLIIPGDDNSDQIIWDHDGLLEGSVYENEPIGTSVLKISARTRRSDVSLEYYVTNVTANRGGAQVDRLFDIDMKSGLLQTSRLLDREIGVDWYEVEIYAVIIGDDEPNTSSTKVRVTVLDKNDVAPSWGPGLWRYQVSEEASPNMVVTTLKASDPDTIGNLRYTLITTSRSFSNEFNINNNHEIMLNDLEQNEIERQFRLDSISGQLRLNEALDREKRDKYHLRVRADDGLQHTDINLIIQVTDTNDNAPIFQSSVYSFDIAENVSHSSQIGQVIAIDADAEGPNSQLSYALISDWANDVFSLNPTTGVLTLTAGLDYEQVQHYILVAQATDGGLPALSTTVTVYCNVIDLNDNTPIFDPGPRGSEILENVTIGTSVLSVLARDLDSGNNGRIIYDIIDGDDNNDFDIAPNGTIFTKKMLDREVKFIYSLIIRARDCPELSIKSLSSTVQVTITILDINDIEPEFISRNQTYIMENASINTVIMAVKAVDTDEGRNGYVEYFLEDPSSSFTLGTVDGLLRVSKLLDREQKQNYTLKVTAKDRGEPIKSSETMIAVYVLDENDNSPVFDPKQYSATVAENASIGASVLQVFATDRDEGANGRIRFSIALGDENRDFTISEDSGVIRVAKNLNFERKSKYKLTIKAEDCATEIGGIVKEDNTEITINVLDINDNSPVFLNTPYLAYVMENMVPPENGFITQVKAYDADTPPYNDQVRYFLKEGDTDLFRINASTGDIFLLRPLDRETVSEYTLTLVAMDTGSPPLTGSGILKIIVLDVNDHSPKFSRSDYKATISENLPAGTWVFKPIATDKDEGLNSKIRYSLLGEKTERFSVNSETGEILTLVSLDREETSIYHLTLIAQDSSPTEPRAAAVNLTIYVQDLNDNPPKFSSPRYTAYITDSTKPGDFVFGAKAVDDDEGENSRIIYQLQGEDSDLFVIDSLSGVIRAMKNLSNSKITYQLQIKASDCGLNTQNVTADLVIHLWERKLFPSFSSGITTQFSLSEDVPEGQVITTLTASTPKMGVISNLIFAMAGGNIGDALRIDAHSGDVIVASGFDYETAPTFEAWIEVRDSDNPPLRSVVQLLINVTDANDNAPIMEAAIYNASVIEEEYPPLYVTKVTAKDLDSGKNGQVYYYLVNDYDESFIIDEYSGEISTNLKLDREELDSYMLVVEARDQGYPILSGSATVMVSILDKNDNPPRFTRLFSVNVTENSEIGTFVIRITSSDQDIGINANVTYSFTENPSKKFSIDSSTGIVQVNGYLDREEQDEYLLKVGAADGAWVAETTLTITIQDQNDNTPEFTQDFYYFNFPELQRQMALIGQVSANDRDKQGPNSVISYNFLHPSDLFSIDPATGDIFSKKTLHYKHTHQPSSPENIYSLTVIATDNGKPPLSSKVTVYINVVNANNHSPKFEERSYLSPVPEGCELGKKIIKLIALDNADFGVNAEIEYSLLHGNLTNYFDIESKTGWIYVAKNIKNIPIGSIFTAIVKARDKGIPPQEDQVNLSLVITGENKYAPTFAASSYQVRVPENEPVNTTILTVNAVDNDSGPNGMIKYEISSDNNQGVFSINSVTGAIMILKPLDYDTIQEFRLNITATDFGFKSKTSVATLTINVSDINDNPPIFNQSLYDAYIAENLAPKSFVYKVEAKDIDSPKYAIIQYRIIGGSGKDHFQIEHNTGIITSKISFNYEETNQYILDIVAANPDSNPPMVGFTRVLIHITGINEYYPKFIQPVFHMDVSESAEIGTSIGLVQATDQDSGEDGKVYYLFVGSSNDRGFSIGSETGIISVVRKLDRETQNRVILTVMAKNGGGIRGNDIDEAQVIISIQDGNDPPEFLQNHYDASISEGAPLGTKILTVRAIDKDVKPQNNQFSYSIMAGNIGQTFKVDPQSGDIETAKILDRESIPSYELYIGAIDTGFPPQTGTVIVRIDLLDINDNGPILEPTEVIGYVNENEPAGTSIMTLAATDPDLPPNGAPFTYRLIGERQVNIVTLDKHSGVLRTTKSFDREIMSQLDLLVEVEDSGLPKLKSEYTVTVVVLDENDSPSTPRSVHVIVHSLNGHTPMGKIADVHPNDPDTTGDYTCKILQGSNPGVLSIPIACDLHTSKITPGLGYSLSVSGNDGRHPDVMSKVTVEFLVFSNVTIDNSITLQINKITASEFLAKYYRPLLDMLQDNADVSETISIFSIGESENNLEIYLAIETAKGYKMKSHVINWLSRNKKKIQQLLDGNNIIIGYSPCQEIICNNGGTCNNQIVVYDDARIIDSQNLIFTSPRINNEVVCKCREGFIGNLCEKRQDPCSPNPCLEKGQCRRLGYDFVCSCLPNRSGKLCELERGDACARNPCKNGGSCQVSPDGSNFFCLCRAGYRGNHCEIITDFCRPNPCLYDGICISQKPEYQCSCPEGRYGRHCERSTYGFDELSFMTFPALDSTTNDITIIFATIKPDALFLYNYGTQSGGRSDFIVLELISGKISFSYGGSRSAITTIKIEGGNRLDDGEWKKVTATRNGRVVSLSVSECREHGDICDDCKPGDESCYADDIGPIGTLNFNNNPFFLGGLNSADPILERSGQIHSDDFVGCIHSVSINGRTLNLSNPLTLRGIKNTCTRPKNGLCYIEKDDTYSSICGLSDKCYDKWHQISCQCDYMTAPNCRDALEPINLSEGGFIEFKISEQHRRMQLLEYLYGGTTAWSHNYNTDYLTDKSLVKHKSKSFSQASTPPKKMSLMFKTIKADGILIYAATNKHYTLLELKNGQLSYTSHLGTIVNMTGYIEGSLADGRWHNLTIFTHLREVKVLVDGILTGDELDSVGVHDFLDPYLTVLFIGGIRQDFYHLDTFPIDFEGCLANFTINDELQPFNGSGSIFKNVIYYGKVLHGCKGPIGISAATVTDPLSIGITLVIVFFVILLIAIVVSFIVFRLRRLSKEKTSSVMNKNTNAIITGNSLVSSGGNDGIMSRHENTYITTDTLELRGVVSHMGPELLSKKFKERDINNTNEHRPQRPDIIEREVTTKSPLIRDEHLSLSPPTSSLHSHEQHNNNNMNSNNNNNNNNNNGNNNNNNIHNSSNNNNANNNINNNNNNEADMPEHYDLENASSIAPSDIDIVYHYKGYRDGMRKYKASPPPIGNYTNHHKHTGTPHRHVGSFPPPRAMAPPNVGGSVSLSNGGNSPATPTPKLLQSTPLARLSPSSELSAQQPRILTLHDISGKPLQSALFVTTSSSGGVGKDVLNSNSERSLNSPIMSQLSGSTASRKAPQSNNNNSSNNVGPPMGLTAEEIERLNSRPRTSSLVSTLDAVSSSSEARGPLSPSPHGPLHLHRRRHSPPQKRLERRNSSTTDESGNDSFTCSEIEYDNNSLVGDKRSNNLYNNKPENREEEEEEEEREEEENKNRQISHRNNESPQSTKPPLPSNVNVYDGFDSSFRGSLSTLVASDDDLSTHMGSLYRPTNNGSPSAIRALGWDYLLNWGPNFENLIGVFIDIAELPDSNSSNRINSNNLRLPSNIPKSSEEYV